MKRASNHLLWLFLVSLGLAVHGCDRGGSSGTTAAAGSANASEGRYVLAGIRQGFGGFGGIGGSIGFGGTGGTGGSGIGGSTGGVGGSMAGTTGLGGSIF